MDLREIVEGIFDQSNEKIEQSVSFDPLKYGLAHNDVNMVYDFLCNYSKHDSFEKFSLRNVPDRSYGLVVAPGYWRNSNIDLIIFYKNSINSCRLYKLFFTNFGQLVLHNFGRTATIKLSDLANTQLSNLVVWPRSSGEVFLKSIEKVAQLV